MAITLGTPAYAYRASGSGANISYSVSSFSVPTDATGLLIFVHILTAITGTPIVTFRQGAGTPVTATFEKSAAGASNQGQVFVYSVAAPATGSAGTITFNQPSGFSAGYIDASYLEVVAVSGGDATTVVAAVDAKAPGNTAAPAVTTTVDGCVCVTTAGTYYNGNTPSYSGPASSPLWADTTDNSNFIFTGRSLAAQPAGTYTATWSVAYNGVVATLAALNPGSGGGGGAAAQTVYPAAIASAEAIGAFTRSASVTLSQTGIATSEAFGAVTASGGSATLAPTGIAGAEAFGAATLSNGASGASGFSYYRSVTIDHTKVAGALSNFPVTIAGAFAYLATTANGGKVQSSSGYDIAFYADSAAATPLNFERVSWDATTGAAEFWVNVPSLSATVDTVIYLFYGQASQSTDLANKTASWDANHVAVFHCSDAISAVGDSIADSTASANPLTIVASGSGSGSSTVASSTGAFSGGKAVTLNQQGEYLFNSATQASASGMGSNHSTISCWYKCQKTHTGNDSGLSIFGAQPVTYPNHTNRFYLNKNNTVVHQVGSDSDPSSASSALTTDTWYHLAATYSGSIRAFYLNGSLVGSVSFNKTSTDDVLTLGNAEGSFDELRASKVARSANWIATEYASMASGFLALGAEQTSSGVTLAATPIGSAEAFGTLALQGARTLTLTGLAGGEALGASTLAPGSATLAQTGIATAEAFGTFTRTSAVALSPAGIGSDESFGAPAVSLGAATLTPIGVATGEAFGSFTVTPGTAPLAQSGIGSGEAFGASSLAGGNAAVAAPAIPSAEGFGAATLSNYTVLLPAAIASGEAFGAPALAGGPVSVAGTAIVSAEAFGAPALSSAASVAPAGIVTAEAFGAFLAASDRAFGLASLAGAEAFGLASLIQNGFFTPAGISSAEVFGAQPGIVASAVVSLSGLSSAEAFGLATLLGNNGSIFPGSILSAEAFGLITLGQPLYLTPPGIPSAETIFSPRIRPAKPLRVITYPNGQVLRSMALTPQAFNITLQTLTAWMLGCDPASDPRAYYKVRLEWPTQGQPAWGVDEDICFVRATEEDGAYNKIRDRKLAYQDALSLESTDTFTRIWRVSWSFYGPNSFDNARQVKSSLLTMDFVSDQLAQMDLYLNTEIGATTRAPEKFQGQWWERTDLAVRMNELVTESLSVNTIASAEVILIENDRGPVADLTI